jgi:type 1 fimbria pilin
MAVIGQFKYDQTDNALTTAFVEYTFFHRVKGFVVYNKAAAGESTIEVSIDGTEENCSVDPGDVVHFGNLVNSSITNVSLKYTSVGGAGAPDYQLMSSEK